jgi:hypothetical protein
LRRYRRKLLYRSPAAATHIQRNAKLISAGCVTIQQASVSQLPFGENTFDLASSIRATIAGQTIQEITQC